MSIPRRQSTRVVVLDPDGRVLLIRARDPAPPYRETLLLPGGAAERGETLEQAALRELREETGLVLRGLDGFLGSVDTEFELGGRHRVQREAVFFAQVDRAVTDAAVLDAGVEDAAALIDVAWWRLEEALSSGLPVYPDQLPALLASVS